MSDQYCTTRLARPDDTDAVLRLVRTVHGDRYPALNRSYWDWRYLSDAPFHADVVVAEHKGDVIGIQPVALFDFRWNEDRMKGAMYTGVLTHPAHRRRGVFRSLVSSANEHAAHRGASFSMTMPNEASLPGFRRFGGWEYPGPIPLYVKLASGVGGLCRGVGRVAANLLGLPPRVKSTRPATGRLRTSFDVETVDHPPDELDELAESFARHCSALTIIRSTGYWNWRYCSKPASTYRTLLARRGGQVVGVVVTSAYRRFALEVGMILDLVAVGGLLPIRELLRIAEQDCVSRGVGLIACQATSPLMKQALKDEGYRCPRAGPLLKRFHFVYFPTGVAGMPRKPNNVCDWHLSFGDSDNI